VSEDEHQELEVQPAARPDGALWTRSAELVGVSYPDRTIELVVLPYEVETLVDWQGRMVTESIARGAFDGIQRRANRIRANRDHAEARTFGRVTALHPSRENGLVGEIRCAKTPLGDETLELAADGCLDASAGFLPMAGGMKWLTRNAYRITRGWLGHVALVPEGAYGEHAGVLAVRAAATTTTDSGGFPNRERWRAMLLEDRVKSDAALNR
jgi:phage head maturation protease